MDISSSHLLTLEGNIFKTIFWECLKKKIFRAHSQEILAIFKQHRAFEKKKKAENPHKKKGELIQSIFWSIRCAWLQ